MGSIRTATLAVLLSVALASAATSAVPEAGAAQSPAGKPPAPVALPPRISDLPSASGLAGVSCPTADECVVVGASQKAEGLVDEIVKGKAGKPVTEDQADSGLLAVTCPSVAFCLVGGQALVPATPAAIEEGTLALYTHGAIRHLQIYPSANGVKGSLTEFSGLACQSATVCWAVGYGFTQADGTDRYFGVLAEVSVDLARSTFTADVSSVAETTALNGVTCPTASRCWVVGDGPTGAAAEFQITRTAMGATVTTTLPDYGGDLSVACSAATTCTTVGTLETNPSQFQYISYAEKLSADSAGTVQQLPAFASLSSVANLDPHHQIAVGTGAVGAPGVDLITNGVAASSNHFVVRFPGARPGRSSVGAGGQANGPLYAVSCPDTTYCMAVGDSRISGTKSQGDVVVLGFENIPGAPSLSVTSATRTSVTLELRQPTDTGGVKIRGYRLVVDACRAHSGTCSVTSVRHLSFATAGHETVTALKAGTTYRFQASAFNAFGPGAGSAIVSATTKKA